MNIHLFSDLHLPHSGFVLPASGADVLLLAGNIGPGLSGLGWVSGQAPGLPVVYVPGVLELAGQGADLLACMRAMAGSRVHLLLNEARVLAGVRFIGVMLWSESACLAGSGPDAARDSGQATRHQATRPALLDTVPFDSALFDTALFDADLVHKQMGITTPQAAHALHLQSRPTLYR